MRLSATIRTFGKDDRQFAIADDGPALLEIERTVDADPARETAELALDHMKRLGRGRDRRRFLTCNQDHTRSKHHAKGCLWYARHVHHDFDGFIGLEHIERRTAFAGRGALLGGERFCKLVEDGADVVRQLADFSGRDERELRHADCDQEHRRAAA